MRLLVSTVLLVLLAHGVVPYGSGPPAFTPESNPNNYTYCMDLTPGHSSPLLSPADSPVTFSLKAGADGKITVGLTSGVAGFIIQGRDDAGAAVGKFTTVDTTKAQIVAGCGGDTTVGHTNANAKTDVAFTWEASEGTPMGNVTFHGTFVNGSNNKQIWGVVTSDKIVYGVDTTGGSQGFTSNLSLIMLVLCGSAVAAIFRY